MANEYQKDGDIGFIGLNSRDNPSALPQGIVSQSQNFRLDRGVATVRKGAQRKTVGALIGQTIYGVGTYIDNTGQEIIICVVTDGLYSYNPQTEILSAKVSFPAGETITTQDGCDVVTAVDKVYISRGWSKRPLMWDLATSIIALPTSPAVNHKFPNCTGMLYYANRMIVLGKYHNEVNTLRNYDTVSVSNFLDFAEWDAIDAFTINNGSNDQVVGVAPWTLNEFLVFMRNSIFYINVGDDRYISGDGLSATSYIKTLATDIGCSARKSVVQAGGGIFFLSDNGVYFLQPQPASSESMKLLTMADPISSPIDDVIQRINRNYAYRAVATYWNNRYYLSVPLDDSEVNNAVLVYNFILRQWESVDTYPVNASIENNKFAANGSAFYTSGPFIELQIITQTQSPPATIPHGLLVGDKVNITFTTSYATPTGIGDRKYPNGTYTVFSVFNPHTFNIRIPYTDDLEFLDLGGFRWGCEMEVAKAATLSFMDFVVAKKDKQRRMYMVNDKQGILLLEELDYDEFGPANGKPILPFYIPDTLSPPSFKQNPINAILKTRRYSFNSIGDKRFSTAEVEIVTTAGSQIKTTAEVFNPDTTTVIDSFGAQFTEDCARRSGIRKIGTGVQLKFDSYNLRPSIRSAYIYATTQKQTNTSKQ